MSERGPAAARSSGTVRLVVSMLKVGTIGFGGGSALIPVIEDEIVRRRGALDDATFTRHTVVASITPGALPVKLAGLAGLEVSGGMLAALLAVVVAVPGTALTLLLVATLSSAGAGAVLYVEFASVGISAFIIALLVHYITTVHRRSGHRSTALGIILVAALATGTPAIVRVAGLAVGQRWQVHLATLSAVQVIGLTLAVVLARAALRRWSGVSGGPTLPVTRGASLWPKARRAVLVLVVVAAVASALAVAVDGPRAPELLALVAASTISSFGGGEAYVAVADGFFVAGGFLDSTTYYTQLVPIANALPGPILVKLAAAIGHVVGGAGAGGWALGVAAALVAVATGTAVAVLFLAAYDAMRTSPLLADVGAYVLPVIAGMLIATSASMLGASADVAGRVGVPAALVVWLSIAAVTVVVVARHRWRVPDIVLLLTCACLSTACLVLA